MGKHTASEIERIRKNLKDDLLWVGLQIPKSLDLFRRMYSPEDLSKSIELIVDDLAAQQLLWAVQQVKNTLDKRS